MNLSYAVFKRADCITSASGHTGSPFCFSHFTLTQLTKKVYKYIFEIEKQVIQ